jgi:phosphate transport system substrate-binding protein
MFPLFQKARGEAGGQAKAEGAAARARGLLFSALFSLAFAASLARAEDSRLMISGSTTVLPIAEAAAEVFMKSSSGVQLSVSGTGTGEGIKSLTDGNVDIAGASRDLLPVEAARAKRLGVELQRRSVALDSLAVVVHPENPLAGLTMDQLEGIYVGRYKSWSELGGLDRPIIAINRDSSSGTFEMWLEKVLKGQRYRPDAQVQPSGGGVTYAVGGNRNAIGYVGTGFLSDRVKVLEIDGVAPTPENVQSGLYPLSRELYMFTRAPAPEPARRFLEFLGSPEGVAVVVRSGFLPPMDR